MSAPAEPAVGEAWACRARYQDPLVHVVVVRFGVKTPRRVRVRFVDGEFEAREDWVPPARLKARWQDIDAFIAREHRWEAVVSVSPDYDAPDESAASIVFDRLTDSGLARLGYNAERGVIRIHDIDGLAASLDLDPAELRADPVSFEEEGDLVASWPITLKVARRAAERDPHRILRYVEHEEADARQEAVFGQDYPKRGRGEALHISPEICAQVDEDHGKPVRAIRREWCGTEPVDLRNEIAELRKETARLGALAESALDALRRSGQVKEADRLEREFGTTRESPRRRR